jgi:hypothetical protein
MSERISRRDILQMGALGGGGLLTANSILLDPQPLAAGPMPVPPSDRVRFGMIGVGMQGSGLLPNAIGLPGIECVAAADLYDERHTLAKDPAPLSGFAGPQGHRLHRGRRARSLAHARGGGRL